MEETKSDKKSLPIQTTLDRFEYLEDVDSDYGHLVDHLIDCDQKKNDNSHWTRVFSRDEEANKRIQIHKLGPDLIYDSSIRDSLQELSNPDGGILFSPFMFEAKDLKADVSENQVSIQELLRLGKTATSVKARFSQAIEGLLVGQRP